MGQRRVEFVSKLISNALFAVGVAAVVLVLLGGTTWSSGGFWASDGAYSRSISPVICIAWLRLCRLGHPMPSLFGRRANLALSNAT